MVLFQVQGCLSMRLCRRGGGARDALQGVAIFWSTILKERGVQSRGGLNGLSILLHGESKTDKLFVHRSTLDLALCWEV